MSTTVKTCDLCNERISARNWARHLKSENHLRNWALHEGIHEVRTRKVSDFTRIKEDIEWFGNLNTDEEKNSHRALKIYEHYGLKKLKEFAVARELENVDEGEQRGIRRTRFGTKRKIIKRLVRSHDEKNKKLHIYTMKKLCEIANKRGIAEKADNKVDLIEQIFKQEGLVYCKLCRIPYGNEELHKSSEEHHAKSGKGLREEETLSQTRRFRTAVFNNTSTEPCDISQFLSRITYIVFKKLRRVIDYHGSSLMYMSLECDYMRDISQIEQKTTMTFHSKSGTPVLEGDDLDLIIESHFQEMMGKESRYQPAQGSGWTFARVKRVMLNTASYNPLGSGSYIKLDSSISAKKACINIQNEKDNLCFCYSILCALDEPKVHPERPKQYKDKINDPIFENFNYPMALKDIPAFEKLSHEGGFSNYPSMAINVFEVVNEKSNDKGEIAPVYISKLNKSSKKIVDLLIITNEDEEKQHYVLIKDLCKLVRSQLTKHHGKIYLCRRCLNHFYSQEILDNHENYCGNHKPAVVKMPSPGCKIKFEKHINKFPVPYVIYADWESLLEKITNVGEGKNTEKLSKHVPYGFSTYLVSRVDGEDKLEPCVHRARSNEELPTVVNKFIENLHDILIDIADKYEHIMEMGMTPEEEMSFLNATICHICEQELENSNDRLKVRDHCHLTGAYMGAAHQDCNINRRLPLSIPVFLHNLSNYDAHLFIEELFHYESGQLTAIASTEEKYISFWKDMFHVKSGEHSRCYKLCFVDTFRFLPSSVEKLANYLEDDQMVHLNNFIDSGEYRNYLQMDEQSAFQALRGKGVFPYEFIDDIEKLNYTGLLQPKDFRDSLNSCDIDDDDYEVYRNVWGHLKKNTLGTYSDLYNIQDVLLLADIFENFRNVCLQHYQLDPAYYITAPSLAWDAMLKKTKCEIELITDPNMHLMIERGIRGGIAQISKRHAKANNKYLEDFDDKEPSKYLMYLDACNLYGWALSQPLPYQDYKWENDSAVEIWASLIEKYDLNQERGYILEVDLEYPRDLHNKHRCVPFASEHFNNKLCTTLNDKSNYVVHIRNLQQILKHGLQLKNVHRVMSFIQKPFMEPYVQFNSDMRKQSKNKFEESFYKGMVNSVFGRTMMNLRKRAKIMLCNEEQAIKRAKKPSFERFTIFSGNFIACRLQQNKILLDQPIQVGFAVLDISKVRMYEFFYEKLTKWDPSTELILMDTDSYLVEMSLDPYEIIENQKDEFDTSNYPLTHPLYSLDNKNVPGKFKDELGGSVMTEVVGLRAKLYTYLYKDPKVEGRQSGIKCKGIRKNVAKTTIKLKDFYESLLKDTNLYRSQVVLRSRFHRVFTEIQSKLALSSNDDKRYICNNKIKTLPWGHFEIPKEGEESDNDV